MTIQNDPMGDPRVTSSLPNQPHQEKLLSRFLKIFHIAVSLNTREQPTPFTSLVDDDWLIVRPTSDEEKNVSTKTLLHTWRSPLEDTSHNVDRSPAADRILDFLENSDINLNLSDLSLTTLPDVFSHHAFQNLKILNIGNSNINEFPPTFKELRIRDLHPLALIININSLASIPEELCNNETKTLISTALSKLPNAPTTLTLTLKKNLPPVVSDETLDTLIDLLISSNELELANEIANTLQNNDKKAAAIERIQVKSSENTPTTITPNISSRESPESLLIPSALQEPTLQYYQELLENSNQHQENLIYLKALSLISKLSPEVFQCFSKQLLKEIDQPIINKKLIARLQNEIELATDRARAKAPTPESCIPTRLSCIEALNENEEVQPEITTLTSKEQAHTLQHYQDILENLLKSPDLTHTDVIRLKALERICRLSPEVFQYFNKKLLGELEQTTINRDLIARVQREINRATDQASDTPVNPIEMSQETRTLMHTINTLIETKQFQEGMNLVDTILLNKEITTAYKIEMLNYIIEELIENKYFKEAVFLTSKIPEGENKDFVLIQTITLLIRNNRTKKAMEVIHLIEDPNLKSSQLIKIVDLLIKKQATEKALEILHALPDSHLKSLRLLGITDSLIENGQLEKALEILQQVPDDHPEKTGTLKTLLRSSSL